MRHIYLIARREYLSYVATIGFWVSLAMIPIFLLLGMALPALMDRASGIKNFTVIDPDGRYERAIEQSFIADRAEHIYYKHKGQQDAHVSLEFKRRDYPCTNTHAQYQTSKNYRFSGQAHCVVTGFRQ